MKLIEKLTDEEVDEMIPEAGVDDAQCSEQIVGRTSSSDRRKNRGSLSQHSTGANPQNESLHRSSTCQDTHEVVEKVVKDSSSKWRAHRMQSLSQTHDPAVNW